MTSSSTLPAQVADLLERPLFAHLATVDPTGAPSSSVMWFVWDGEVVRFTHTSTRRKFRNIQAEPRVAFSIHDPDDGYRSLEVRGVIESIEPDPEASFYRSLQVRYSNEYRITDAAVRVVLTMRPTLFVTNA